MSKFQSTNCVGGIQRPPKTSCLTSYTTGCTLTQPQWNSGSAIGSLRRLNAMRYTTNSSSIASFAIAIVLALASLPSMVSAQSASSAFTVEDLLDVANINLADLSDDGRWLAVISGSLRDRIGIDNHRFGDPTYVAPALVDVLIVDTQTAKTQKPFQAKKQVRGLKWS